MSYSPLDKVFQLYQDQVHHVKLPVIEGFLALLWKRYYVSLTITIRDRYTIIQTLHTNINSNKLLKICLSPISNFTIFHCPNCYTFQGVKQMDDLNISISVEIWITLMTRFLKNSLVSLEFPILPFQLDWLKNLLVDSCS